MPKQIIVTDRTRFAGVDEATARHGLQLHPAPVTVALHPRGAVVEVKR